MVEGAHLCKTKSPRRERPRRERLVLKAVTVFVLLRFGNSSAHRERLFHGGCAEPDAAAAIAIGRALYSAAICTKWQARLGKDFKRWRDRAAAVSSSIRRWCQQQAYIRGNDGIYCSAAELSVGRVRANLSSHRQAAACACHQDDDVWLRDAACQGERDVAGQGTRWHSGHAPRLSIVASRPAAPRPDDATTEA